MEHLDPKGRVGVLQRPSGQWQLTNGRPCWCASCMRAYVKAKYDANPREVIEKAMTRYYRDIERSRAVQRDRYFAKHWQWQLLGPTLLAILKMKKADARFTKRLAKEEARLTTRQALIDAWHAADTALARQIEAVWRQAAKDAQTQEDALRQASMDALRPVRVALRSREITIPRRGHLGRPSHKAARLKKRVVAYGVPHEETLNLDTVYARDQHVCHWCGHHVMRSDASMDHLVPQSNGGAHRYDNVALAHLRCNSQRLNRHAPPGEQLTLL